jgi:hypothetical protein
VGNKLNAYAGEQRDVSARDDGYERSSRIPSRGGRQTIAVLMLAVVFVIAGCGGDDGDQGDDAASDDPTVETTAPPESDAGEDETSGDSASLADCPMTEADVSGVFGVEMTAMAQERVGSGCGFESVEDPIFGPQAFYRLQSELALQSFGPEAGGEEVGGLGDEAVFLDDGLGSGSAIVRTGDEVFEIQVIDDSEVRDPALALAAIVLAAS